MEVNDEIIDESDDSFDLFLPNKLSQRALVSIEGTEDIPNTSPYFKDDNGKIFKTAIQENQTSQDSKLCSIPLLLRRTEDERDKIVNDKVALVLMNDGSNKENSSVEELNLESDHLRCNFDDDTLDLGNRGVKSQATAVPDNYMPEDNINKSICGSNDRNEVSELSGDTTVSLQNVEENARTFYCLGMKVLSLLSDELQNLHHVSECYLIDVICDDGYLKVHSNILQVRCPNIFQDVNENILKLEHSFDVSTLFFTYIYCGKIEQFQNISIDTRLAIKSLCEKYGMALLKEVISFNWMQALDLCPAKHTYNYTEGVLAKYVVPSPTQSPQYERFDDSFDYLCNKKQEELNIKQEEEDLNILPYDLDSFLADYGPLISLNTVKTEPPTITVDSDSDDCVMVSTTSPTIRSTTIIEDSDNSDVEVIGVVPPNKYKISSNSSVSSNDTPTTVSRKRKKINSVTRHFERPFSSSHPEYHKMSDDQLKKELDRYGMNGNLSRDKALKLLPYVFDQIQLADLNSSPRYAHVKKKRKKIHVSTSPQPSTSTAPDPESVSVSESSDESGDTDIDEELYSSSQAKKFRNCIIRGLIKLFIVEKPDSYKAMLMYRPVKLSKIKSWMVEFYGSRISKTVLKEALDEFGILFRRNQNFPKKKRKSKTL